MTQKSNLAFVASYQQRFSRPLLHGLLILNFGLAIGYVAAWCIAWRQGLFWRADFSAFYTGWAIVRDGMGARLFDFPLQARYQAVILAGRSFKDGLLPFVNPPGIVLLLTPLARLPLSTAFGLWTMGMVVLFAWLILLLWKVSDGWEPLERWLLLSVVAAFPPLFTTFLLGAFSLLMLVCFLQFYLAFKHNRQATAAAWLFIAAIKPQLIILPAAMVCVARRWRTLIWATLAGLVMLLVSSAFLGWRIWLDYANQFRVVSSFFGKYGIDPAGMYNFRGILTTMLGAEHSNLINGLSMFALGLSILATALIWLKPFDPGQPSFELRMALTLGMALFFNLHLYPQDGLLYVAPALLFYIYLRRSGRPRLLFAAFLLLCPFFFLFTEFNLGDGLGVRGPALAGAVLVLWVGGEAWKWREPNA